MVKKLLDDQIGADTRETILGHVQRGGSPSAIDRTLVWFYSQFTDRVDIYPSILRVTKWLKMVYLIKTLINLTNLNLYDCNQITDEGLPHLKTINLTSLNLSWFNQITDNGLSHLKTFINLTVLSLYQCKQITDNCLSHLKTLISLTYLSFYDCNQITDNGLSHFFFFISFHLFLIQFISLFHFVEYALSLVLF